MGDGVIGQSVGSVPTQVASLRALRKRSGMSQGEVAGSVGVSRAMIGVWERGAAAVPAARRAALAAAIGVSLDEVVTAVAASSRDGESPEQRTKRLVRNHFLGSADLNVADLRMAIGVLDQVAGSGPGQLGELDARSINHARVVTAQARAAAASLRDLLGAVDNDLPVLKEVTGG